MSLSKLHFPARTLAPRASLILMLLLAVFLIGCTRTEKGEGVYGEYSKAFFEWFYPTNAVAIDVAGVRTSVQLQPHEVLAKQLQELLVEQHELNRIMLEAAPPKDRTAYHQRILTAIETYETETEAFRLSGEVEGLPFTIGAVETSLVELIERVSTCYAQALVCREP